MGATTGAQVLEKVVGTRPPTLLSSYKSYFLPLRRLFYPSTTLIKPNFLPSKTIAKVIGINNFSYRYQ